MAEIKLMQPQAGHWILPLLACATCAESEREDVVVLVFHATAEDGDGMKELSLRIPIPKADGVALLARLQDLQAAGRLTMPPALSEVALDA
jgi:hypothetical protein